MKPAEVTQPANNQVEVRRSFDAPVELVWRAYTEPELLRQWCLGPPGWSMPVCEMDVRVGGKYRWRWRSDAEEAEFGFAGEYREVISNQRIVNTQIYDPGDLDVSMGKEDESVVIQIAFDAADSKTTVTTTMNFHSQDSRDAAVATGMTDGMEMSYQSLDSLLANRTTS